MSGLASKVAGIGGLKGALSTDEVNRSAGGIASVRHRCMERCRVTPCR